MADPILSLSKDMDGVDFEKMSVGAKMLLRFEAFILFLSQLEATLCKCWSRYFNVMKLAGGSFPKL